jgi:putative ABC transport system permease protein
MFDTLRQDLRFALRQLAARPGFTALALLTLTLGIGATTAIFSLVDGVLLRPLPFPEPQRIVDLAERNERGGRMSVSNPNFQDWRELAQSFEAMAAWAEGSATMAVGTEAVRARPVMVTADFLDVLGVHPRIGRGFVEDETRFGGDPAALVSWDFYRRHFDQTRALEDQSVQGLGRSFRVVGVMPPEATFPEGADLWVPTELWEDTSSRTAHNLDVIGRLRPEVSIEAARAEMQALADRLRVEHAGANDAAGVEVTPLAAELVAGARRPLLLLLGAAALVLLVSASNLASSLLARALSRRHELAVRGALGAGRARIVRQLLTESTLLCALGGAMGLGLAFGAVRLVRALEPGRLPRLDSVTVDGRVLLFALAVSLGVGLVFGLVPALFAARADQDGTLSGGRGSGRERAWHTRFWDVLVASEVALALVLLVGAGLLLRTLWALLSVDPGFRVERLLTLDVTTPVAQPSSFEPEVLLGLEAEVASFGERLLGDLAAAPGVANVALVSHAPFGSGPSGTFCLGEAPCVDGDRIVGERGVTHSYAHYRVVSDDYFATMEIPLARGRFFDRRDVSGARHAVIVNETLARETWPGEDPIGKVVRQIGMDLHDDDVAEVVGVIADVRLRGLDQEPRPELYFPFGQRAFRAQSPTVVLATSTAEAAAVAPLRALLRERYPEIPADFVSMSQRRTGSVAEARFSAAVLATFGALALVLAATGIWGVASYRVAQRTRELGIRLALGARPAEVVALALRDVLRVVLAGALVGATAAIGATRLLESQLHEVRPADPGTFGATLLLLVAAGVFACLVPARAVARIDPVEAMTDRA